MVRRSGPLLDGLWEPPGVDLDRGEPAEPSLARALASLGLRGTLVATPVRIRHTITHRAIEAQVWRLEPRRPLPRAGARFRWVAPGERDVALSALARRVLALCSRGASGRERS